MSTVTVKSCIKQRELPAKDDKPAYQIYLVELTDGRKGESFAKEIPSGTPESEITITEDPKYGLKFKWNQPGKGGSGKGSFKPDPYREALIVAQSSISTAKDMAVAGKITYDQLEPSAKKIFDMVYRFAEPFKAKA